MITETEHALDMPRMPHQDTLVERLAERLGVNTNAKTIFGDPIERDGVTVIPVARVRYGFGGGGGGRRNEGGSGGGGGAQVEPLGYIEMKNGTSEFRPIRSARAVTPIIVAGAFTALIVLRGLSRLLNRKRD